MNTAVELLSCKRENIKFVGGGHIDAKLVCKMKFTPVVPEKLIKSSLNK